MAKLTEKRKQQLKKFVLDELDKKPNKKKVNFFATKKSAKIKKNEYKKQPKTKKEEKAQKPVIKKIKYTPLPAENLTNKKSFLKVKIIIPIFLIFILGLLLAIDIWGMYYANWSDPVSRKVAYILQLPAGKINGDSLSLSQYLEDYNLLSAAIAEQREGLEFAKGNNNVSDDIFNRLAIYALVDDRLKKYNIVISEDELAQMYDVLAKQFTNIEEMFESIDKLYGLSPDQFKRKVLLPVLKLNRLQQALVADSGVNINKVANDKAQKVLATVLNEPDKFTDLAEQFTDDDAGVNTGGSMGWFFEDEMSQELNELLFSLPVGSIYPEVLKDDGGYYIYKVDDKMFDDEQNKEMIKVSRIYIAVDVNDYLKEEMEKAEVIKYIKTGSK